MTYRFGISRSRAPEMVVESVPDSHQLKRCSLCGEDKKISSFRYIKFFDKRRSICKRCEAGERRNKRRLVEQQIQEHGVTPGIRRRLETEVREKARSQAEETVFSNLSPERIRIYRWAQRISRICGIVLFLSSVLGVISLGTASVGWLALFIVLGGIASGTRLYFNRRHAEPVDSEIGRHIRAIYPDLFKEHLRERIEDERFYTSPEWRILRGKFLRIRRKINGYHVCEICQETISYDVTIDHFKPRLKFPELALEITNLRIAHRSCNSSKGDIIVE